MAQMFASLVHRHTLACIVKDAGTPAVALTSPCPKASVCGYDATPGTTEMTCGEPEMGVA